jgi:ABC-2 type transport system permease protein
VGIVIPSGASQTLINDLQQKVTPKHLLQFYALPNTNDLRITIVENMVNKVVQSILSGSAGVSQVYQVCHQPGNHCAQNTIDPTAIRVAVAKATVEADQATQTLVVHGGHSFWSHPGYSTWLKSASQPRPWRG